jgi:hypothetical protein
MEPEGSIPCSQELSIGPYPKPYQSNTKHPILLLKSKYISTELLLTGKAAYAAFVLTIFLNSTG